MGGGELDANGGLDLDLDLDLITLTPSVNFSAQTFTSSGESLASLHTTLAVKTGMSI